MEGKDTGITLNLFSHYRTLIRLKPVDWLILHIYENEDCNKMYLYKKTDGKFLCLTIIREL